MVIKNQSYRNIGSAVICTVLLQTTGCVIAYANTQEVRNAMRDTYTTLLQKDSIFNPSTTIKPLEEFGKNMNEYVMKKRGILYGKQSAQKPNNLNASENIFDIWVFLYESFNKLVNTIKVAKASKDDTDARRFLAVELRTDAWQDLGIDQMKKIRTQTRLDGKKRLADTITLFSENTIKLIDKIKQDIKNL